MKQLDLFAGIGGISLAAEWAGIETVAFCEKEPFAQGILRRRFPGRPIYDDVYNLTREVLENDGITGIDIVAGGFPCQPFSHAGKRTGTADNRYLWPQMCRIVGELRPTWVFAENVDGLVSMAQSDSEIVMEDETTLCEEAEMVVETIRKDLENLGYRSITIVIPACGVGASHRRYRILIVGDTERSGQQGQFGGKSDQELEDGYSQCESGIMADSNSIRDHSSGEYRSNGNGTQRDQEWREPQHRSSDFSQIMADSESIRLEGQRSHRQQFTSKHGCEVVSLRGGSNGSERTAQSRLGRGPYELSDWLDGWGMNPLDALINFISSYPQPALMGQEQHAWEPPRVATGIKNRASRLKALGNAVDPLQALPVLYGIRVIHEHLRKGGNLV